VNDDLQLSSFKRVRRQALTNQDRSKRLSRSKALLCRLKKKKKDTVILFSDETPFSLSEIVSAETSRLDL
jgi:hypothetical protein